jgi:hypothetical protein
LSAKPSAMSFQKTNCLSTARCNGSNGRRAYGTRRRQGSVVNIKNVPRLLVVIPSKPPSFVHLSSSHGSLPTLD